MRKWVSAILCITLIGSMLTGCGQKKEDGKETVSKTETETVKTQDSQEASGGPITIQFWNGWKMCIRDRKYISNNYRTVTIQELVEHFHYNEDYYNRLIKKYSGLSLIHIFTIPISMETAVHRICMRLRHSGRWAAHGWQCICGNIIFLP